MSHALPRWWFVLLVALLALALVLLAGDALGGEPFRMPGGMCPPSC
ncbi:MAG TPA: hypothetical protein VFG57_09390 [Gaiella sp.]|jgi:hypothetical protein|nr:hypothetical protein [Gaiella sp.]